MRRGSIEISTWQPMLPRDPGRAVVRSRWMVSTAAAAVTLALHLIFITSIEWGLGSARRGDVDTTPKIRVPGGRAGVESDAMEWILVGDRRAEETHAAARVEAATPALRQVVVDVPPWPDLNLDDATTDTQSASRSSSQGLAAMLGMYVGQIDARIERAWLRPRTPLRTSAFSCSARIEQDETGHVRDIVLKGCNGDERWQQSLVQGIRAASPLPAPPDPRVFRRVITLRFHAQPYSASSNPDLYEPAPVSDPLTRR